MTNHSRGRSTPTPPQPYPGNSETFTGAYSWNAPRPAIATAAGEKPISEDLFSRFSQINEPIPRARRVMRRLESLPHYIRRYYTLRVENIKQNSGAKRANSYLINSIEKYLLPRVGCVTEQYQIDIQSGVLLPFYDDFRRIPYYGKREIKRLAYRLSDCMTGEFIREYDHQMGLPDGDIETAIVSGYGYIGFLTRQLNTSAPGWGLYESQTMTADEALRATARIESPSWWLRRLKHIHDQWREHLMIAAGYVHAKSAPYCSDPALKEWQAQKKSNREFLQAFELEDEDGNRISLVDKYDGSIANPAIRRCELMTRMRGFEDIAEQENLAGDFYTLTAPSKFHSMHNSGKRNHKWRGASPRQTQKYLCRIWSQVRAAWKRAGIRVFGFRVAEPHHDETPHWHMLLFMLPTDIELARDIFCTYAHWEDSEELQSQEALKARFHVVPIDKELGSATGYIAKYISKNIDGYALDDELDDESGKPLKETAKRVSAWASRWRIRQFQQIGGAPVTVYRELRRLRDKELRLFPEISPAQVAADEGNWAGYTLAQGGPLVARKDLRVRLNYDITENGNDYGDNVSRITGVFAPESGSNSIIYTRTTTYKIVPKIKADADFSVDVQGGPPPLGVLSITVRGSNPQPEKSVESTPPAAEFSYPKLPKNATTKQIKRYHQQTSQLFEDMGRKERRELAERIRNDGDKDRKAPDNSQVKKAGIATQYQPVGELADQVLSFLRKIDIEPEPWELRALVMGGKVDFGQNLKFQISGGQFTAAAQK